MIDMMIIDSHRTSHPQEFQPYDLVLDTPKEFHHEIHRPNHFLTFLDDPAGNTGTIDAEMDDLLA